MHGITAYGCYIPRLRLSREAIVAANSWSNGALRAFRKGERAMCNWDEDPVTMAVAAARDCLNGGDAGRIGGILLASTSLPFADRQNAGIVANALMLPEGVLSLDVTASQKAGTSGLAAALEMVRGREGGAGGEVLLLAADQRRTKSACVQELWYGDGAAALTLGTQDVIARFVGGVSRTVDFVDHYRAADREYDYNWEERWIRDEGYNKIVPPAVQALLEQTGTPPADVRFFAMPSVFGPVPGAVARQVGIPAEAVRDTLFATCGEAGAAHPLILLIDALQEAKPGDKLLVVGFGQGCDALLFEATKALPGFKGHQGTKGALANRKEEANYNKFLTFTHQVTKEFGIRAEADVPTPLSALYRKRDMVFGLMGGRCSKCGTAQFPRSEVCVNPECKAVGTQQPLSFADRPAHVKTWTADYLTFTLDPPGHYGMVEFDEGGRFMADFTDVDVGQVEVDMPVRMAFRIKSFDERRGLRRYFWKAVPQGT